MVTVFSNTASEPACLINKLKFSNDNNVDNIQFQRLGWLLPQRGNIFFLNLLRTVVYTLIYPFSHVKMGKLKCPSLYNI